MSQQYQRTPAPGGSGSGASVSDATTSAKGVVQLAGDLGGTAAAPTVPGLATNAAAIALRAPLLIPTATQTAPYTAAVGDLAMMNVAGGAITLTLPTAPADGKQVGYRAIGATNTVPLKILPGGSDTIGLSSATAAYITLADETAVLQYQAAGTRWVAVSNVKTQASLDSRYTLPTALYSQQRRAKADEPVMAADPTYTAYANATSLYAHPRSYPAVTGGVVNATPFRYSDDMGVASTNYVLGLSPSVSGSRAVNLDYYSVEFDFDGQSFELDTFANSGQTYRIWSNEQIVSATYTGPGGGARKYVKVDFGSRAYRRIAIEFDKNAYFGGIVCEGTDVVLPSMATHPRKWALIGDSYSIGTGYYNSGLSFRSYATRMMRRLGVVNYRRYGIAGTGYATSAASNYAARANDVIGYAPDVLIVQGSLNDSGLGSVGTAATSLLTTLQTALPACKIITTGILRAQVATSGDITTSNAIKASATALGIPYVDNIAEVWNTGLGSTTATTGLGNADYYHNGNVSNHPTVAGHNFLGDQLARDIAAIVGIPL